MAYLYFIYAHSYIKIGSTNNLKERLHGIQTSNPDSIILLGYKEYPTMKEARKIEKELHKRFNYFRYGGEWFYKNYGLLKFIKEETQTKHFKIGQNHFKGFGSNYKRGPNPEEYISRDEISNLFLEIYNNRNIAYRGIERPKNISYK